MACDEAVYAAWILLFTEFLLRFSYSNYWQGYELNHFHESFNNRKGTIFIGFYVLSMVYTIVYVKYLQHWSVYQSNFTKEVLPLLYMADSIAAVMLGYSLYYSNFTVFIISMLLLANFFQLHVLNSMFTKKNTNNMFAGITSCTKMYIHHIASFIFVDTKEMIVITTIWRAISMSGHAAQALHLKSYITADQLRSFNWKLTHVRNMMVLFIFCRIVYSWYHDSTNSNEFPMSNIFNNGTMNSSRNSFHHAIARSAIGHIAYMLVRFGPVFRLGSVYVGDRTLWQSHSDTQRLRLVFEWKFPFMTIEVTSLCLLSFILFFMRYFCIWE